MAQNVAEQIGAHSGPITTASSATIATIAVAQRFFRGNFISLFTTLISYLLELSRSTHLLVPYFSATHCLPTLPPESGGPGESRTPGARFRKPLLYPSELQARTFLL